MPISQVISISLEQLAISRPSRLEIFDFTDSPLWVVDAHRGLDPDVAPIYRVSSGRMHSVFLLDHYKPVVNIRPASVVASFSAKSPTFQAVSLHKVTIHAF